MQQAGDSEASAPVLETEQPLVTIGVGLKMYFGYRRSLEWCEQVKEISLMHRAVANGLVELFVIPSSPVLSAARELFSGTRVRLGAQDLHWHDFGPFTGEVSGSMLAELGCDYVEVGHAERRRLFGESDDVVAAKTEAALRNGLVPIICIGENDPCDSAQALAICIGQLESALGRRQPREGADRVLVAYEPIWAIGATEPASAEHIGAVCAGLKGVLANKPGIDSSTIYGGSAGPGLLASLRGRVDGLFLGRSAHDPAALDAVLSEALWLCDGPA
ncbi:MAG: triose-phosphate isomerase family protein [Acidimicrobiales bacterium]